MMKHLIYMMVLWVGILTSADAQTFTQRVQQPAKAGQGSVTIHQSQAIDQLVNSAELGAKATAAKPATPASNASSTGSTAAASAAKTVSSTPRVATPDTTGYVRPTRTQKVMGYRIQAFAGGNSRADRQKAEQTGNSIRAQFPNVAVYVHFYSPRWICRVGNYRSYEEAHQMLVSLRNMGYSEATIVKGKISVAY